MTTSLFSWYRHQAAKLACRHGRRFVQQADYGAAISALNRALADDHPEAAVYALRGFSHWQQGHPEAALADFEAALALDPRCSQAYGYRGCLRLAAGDDTGALADWQQALRCDPGNGEVYYHRACFYADSGAYEAALVDFDRTLGLRPLWTEAYLRRGNVRSQLGDRTGAHHDWEIALCNDLTCEAARTQLQALPPVGQGLTLPESFYQAFAQRHLTVAVWQVEQRLNIMVHREVGVGVNYFTLPALIRSLLVPLQLPGLERFKLIGQVGPAKQLEWSQEYELYQGQPCPPSNWQSALSAFLVLPPIGVTACIYAAQVKAAYNRGQYLEALRASKAVKRLCFAGTGLLCALALVPVGYTALTAIKNEPLPPARTARIIDYNPIQIE